jgi:ribosomal protein S18 acetylase RimI-like enzyme
VTLHTRPAREEDVRAIAELHVRSWKFGHQRIFPTTVVDSVSVEEREASWHERLKGAPSDQMILVADGDGAVLGFASAGPTHDTPTEARIAEIYELFVLPEAIGTGVGGALISGTLSRLKDGGFRAVTLWVVEGNDRARRFYERQGFRPDGSTKTARMSDAEAIEVRYRMSLL